MNQMEKYKKAQRHLEESINLGYDLSFFSLSLLYYKIYKNLTHAFNTTKKGAEKGEKYSKCLLGYFIAHGIGTNKDLLKGVSTILESKAENLYEQFAADIGIYYSRINQEENQTSIFKWFEKAFIMKKTRASINNYGVCFMKGIGVDKNYEKAKEILTIGVNINDSNSMHYLAFLLEQTDKKESLKYYKLSADLGDPRIQFIYATKIEENNQNLALQYYIKAAKGKMIKAQEFLALKYIKENDIENIFNYIACNISLQNETIQSSILYFFSYF